MLNMVLMRMLMVHMVVIKIMMVQMVVSLDDGAKYEGVCLANI